MTKNLRQGIIEASHRLRMIQRDFADQGESEQREYLSEELERLLKEVPFGERAAFLQGLMEQFPGGRTQTPDYPDATVPPKNIPVPAVDQPMQLVEALADGLPSLPEDQKKAIADRLQEVVAGLRQTTETPSPSATDIRSTFQLPVEAEIHGERFGDLANLLAEFVVKTEQLIAAVWGKIAAKSALRPPKQARKLAGRFLCEADGDSQELIKDLQLLLQFSTAIITASSRAGEEVARRHWRRLSPEAIRALVDMEQNRLRDSLVSKDVRCWRKYCDLTTELGAEYIEKEIESAMADYAEAFVRGLERLS